MAIPIIISGYLNRAGIPYEVVRHRYAESSMHDAEAADVSGEDVAKGVLLKDDAGYVLAVLPATHHVRVGELQRQLGRPVEMAPELDVAVVFPDCAHGAVPVLGPLYDVTTIVDESLRGRRNVYCEAGDHEELIRVSGADFESLMGEAGFQSFSVHRP